MDSRSLLALAATSLALTSPAHSETSNEIAARKTLRDLGSCVVASAPEQASRAVIQAWSSDRIVDARMFRAARHCAWSNQVSKLQTYGPALRASLAEALVLREGTRVPSPLSVTPLRYPEPTALVTTDKAGRPMKEDAIDRQQAAIARKSANVLMEKVGECLVRSDAANAAALIGGDIASDSEKRSFAALLPALPACVPVGVQVEITRASMRSSVALAYYRLAKAAAGIVWDGRSR